MINQSVREFYDSARCLTRMFPAFPILVATLVTGDVAFRVCGLFCGPGWCNGERQREFPCASTNLVDATSCPDACCKTHDVCCASRNESALGPKAACNGAFLRCLDECTNRGDNDAYCSSRDGYPVPASAVSTAMGIVPDGWCCGAPCEPLPGQDVTPATIPFDVVSDQIRKFFDFEIPAPTWDTSSLQIFAIVWTTLFACVIGVVGAMYARHRAFVSVIAKPPAETESSFKPLVGRVALRKMPQKSKSFFVRPNSSPSATTWTAAAMAKASHGDGSNRSNHDGQPTRRSPLQDRLSTEEQLALSFCELGLSTPPKMGSKSILRNITGYVHPGELVALMGPSGSGKTSLLDTLAGRRPKELMVGQVYVNGLDCSTPEGAHLFRARTGYMLQLADTFSVSLTVRENLCYAAALRFRTSLSQVAQLERVAMVLKMLHLDQISEVVVGMATGGGISGGQKRKLALGVEMLTMPALLLLDEPTSGLDATSSLEVMDAVRGWCNTGRSAIVTIHQPRKEIFLSFDKLVLLNAGSLALLCSPGQVILTSACTCHTLTFADPHFSATALAGFTLHPPLLPYRRRPSHACSRWRRLSTGPSTTWPTPPTSCSTS